MLVKWISSCTGLLSFLLLLRIRECSSLKSMEIKVPEVVKSGDTVTLSCRYDLEQVPLYSIKWYWNEEEFYRFVPKESPPFRAFSVQYINVDIFRSGPTQVTLKGVRKELSGMYKCEVSADAPLFHTDIKMASMVVAELPSDNPVMNIEPEKVEIGKGIKAECYSPGSDPPANLTWYINDEQVIEDNESVKVYPTKVNTDKALSLKSSRSTLEVTTNRSHFVLGTMTIKCQASIFSLWSASVATHIKDTTPQLAPALGSTSSQSQVEEITSDGFVIGCNYGIFRIFWIFIYFCR